MTYLKQAMMAAAGTVVCVLGYAAPIEGYWKSMDDRSGEPLSLIEIKKEADGTYAGTILHRYPNAVGYVLTHCSKCPPPYKDKPLVGLKILTGFVEDPNKPGHYISGTVVDAKSGGVYKGKAHLSKDGRRLQMRGYIGVSILGRTQVWIRTDKATP